MKKILSGGAGATILRQILLILLSLGIGTIFLAVSGYDPWAIFRGLGTAFTDNLGGTIRWAIPMIMSGLAVCITYRANVFNLGVDGQLHLGAAAAVFVSMSIPVDANSVTSILFVMGCAALAGALFALIPALLRVYLNTDEVITTLLLNFVASLFLDFLILGPMKGTGELTHANTTNYVPENTWLPRLESWFGSTTATIGIFIAVGLCIVIWFVMYRTRFGHDVKIVGQSPLLAKYSGIKASRVILTTMLLSGCVAGLIGAMEVLGPLRRMPQNFNPGIGFDGVVVSLLAYNNPVGVIFTGFFFGGLNNGALNMERFSDVPAAVGDVVQAIIILVVSAQVTIPFLGKLIARFKDRASARKGQNAEGNGV